MSGFRIKPLSTKLATVFLYFKFQLSIESKIHCANLIYWLCMVGTQMYEGSIHIYFFDSDKVVWVFSILETVTFQFLFSQVFKVGASISTTVH